MITPPPLRRRCWLAARAQWNAPTTFTWYSPQPDFIGHSFQVLEWYEFGNSCTVDQCVETSESINRCLYHATAGCIVSHIRLDRQRLSAVTNYLCNRCIRLRFRARVNHCHCPALFGQAERSCLSNTGATAGYDRNFARLFRRIEIFLFG